MGLMQHTKFWSNVKKDEMDGFLVIWLVWTLLNDHIILIVFYITIVSILSLRWHIIDVEFHH